MTSINFEELTVPSIEKKGPKDLILIGRNLNIKEFKDMAELKQKIVLSIMKKSEAVIDSNYYTEDFVGKKEVTFREDELRRQYLTDYVTQIEDIYNAISKLDKIRTPTGIDISEKDDPLKTKIMNEFVNVDEQLTEKKQLLSKTPSCALLICGDSGSGKSSFINLLINDNLLPTSIRSNTSCQVRLTYGKPERAEIVDSDENYIYIEKNNFSDTLQKYLENMSDRTRVSCKSATMYLDCPILKGGLDIYDTIGLGESYVYNDDITANLKVITGIIFLLKKNSPIGDDTVGGLSKVINHMAKNGIPGGSMHFVINMCDLLDNSADKELLKKNVTDQIREKCGGLYPEISTFSTKQELFLQKNNYMSREYEDIMTLIQHLHLNSINTNTISIFEYLFTFVWKTINYIVESEYFAASGRAQKKEYIHKLRNLESDRKLLNQSFKKHNERFIKEKYNKYQNEIEKHFHHEETKKKVITDVVSKHSKLFGMTNTEEIDNEIIEYTHEAILKNFKEYIEKENLLGKCCDEMMKVFLQQFAEHQKKKDIINQTMNQHINMVISNIKTDLKIMSFNDLIGLPSYQRKILQIFAPIMIPGIEIKNMIKREIESAFSWIISRFNSAHVQKFYEDTVSYVTMKSADYYSKFIGKRRNIRKIMDCLFIAPNKVTDDFETYLMDDMNYLAKNINLLDEDMRNEHKVIETYKNTKERLERINEDLCRVVLLQLQRDKYDIMKDQIEIQDSLNTIIMNRSRILYKGQFKNVQQTDSAILVFKKTSEKSWRDLYQEYCLHKDLQRNIQEKDNLEISKSFLEIRYHILSSINDTDFNDPTFVVSGIDHSLKSYIKEYKNLNQSTANFDQIFHKELRWLLQQILNGLNYLHQQKPKLVHYDLTVDSIGYNSTYRAIKLSSISYEIKVQIDYSVQNPNDLLTLVHFPPNILKRNSTDLYTSETDIYCLGTILYYLWVGINPFFDVIIKKRIGNVDQFVDLLSHSKLDNIIPHQMFSNGFGEMIFVWSTLCWKKNYTAGSFYEAVMEKSFYGSVTD